MPKDKMTGEKFTSLYKNDPNFRELIDGWPYLSEWAKLRIYLKIMYAVDMAPFWRLLRWLVNEFRP